MDDPRCFGLLHNAENKQCQYCLIQDQCALETKEMLGDAAKLFSSNGLPAALPKDKKLSVFLVAQALGLPLEYSPRGSEEVFEVTKESLSEYSSVDFLLSSRKAVEKLWELANVKKVHQKD